MSKASVKAVIDAAIRQNGNQEITATVLNSVLNQMVDEVPDVVNDVTTGGTGKALSAEMGKDLGTEVSQLAQEVYGKTEEKLLPESGWMSQTFGTLWGSAADKIYIDIRNEIDKKHKIKQFKIYGKATGTIRVYFLRKKDFSVVTYHDVTIASINNVSTFDIILNDSDYLDGPMYVGIWSSIVWGSLAGVGGDYPNTYTYSIANNTITSVSSRAWGYGIVIEETISGDLDNVDERLDSIETKVDTLFPVDQTLPSSDWLDGQFRVSGGGSADYVFYDARCVIPNGASANTIRIKATGAGEAIFYRFSASGLIIASYNVYLLNGLNQIILDFTATEGEKIGVCSASGIIGMRAVETGEEKNTYTYRISTGATAQSNYHLAMDVLVSYEGKFEEMNRDIDNLEESVAELNDAIFETKILPSAEWIDGTFPMNGGGDAQYAFFDSRTLIPAGVIPERVRFKATSDESATIYLINASDYSILASETITPIIGINELSLSFASSLYNVPTYIGVGSAGSPIAMRDTQSAGETSYTNRLTIATGEVFTGRRYAIAVEVKYTTIKTNTISRDLDEVIAQSGGNDIVLGPYDYSVTSPIVLTSGMTIRGSFGKTRLILTDGCQTAITASNADGIKISDLEIVGTCPNYTVEMNGIVVGTGYDLVATEADAIALNYMGSEKGIYLYYCENVVLENLRINHIDGSAIRVNHTGMNYTKGLNACNLFITNCYNGIYCENEHEFSQYTNWTVTSCMIGVYVASGNLIFTAGHATRCRFAMMFVAGTNHAHGVVNGIEIKHNQVAGIFCNGVVYGEFFEGIYLSYSPLVIRDSTGVYFDDIMVGNMSIDVTGTSGVNKIGKLVKRNNGISMVNTDTLTILESVELY